MSLKDKEELIQNYQTDKVYSIDYTTVCKQVL